MNQGSGQIPFKMLTEAATLPKPSDKMTLPLRFALTPPLFGSHSGAAGGSDPAISGGGLAGAGAQGRLALPSDAPRTSAATAKRQNGKKAKRRKGEKARRRKRGTDSSRSMKTGD